MTKSADKLEASKRALEEGRVKEATTMFHEYLDIRGTEKIQEEKELKKELDKIRKKCGALF
jgi:hypothetical protein